MLVTSIAGSLWPLPFRTDYLIIMVFSGLKNLNYTCMKTDVNTKHKIKERGKCKIN